MRAMEMELEQSRKREEEVKHELLKREEDHKEELRKKEDELRQKEEDFERRMFEARRATAEEQARSAANQEARLVAERIAAGLLCVLSLCIRLLHRVLIPHRSSVVTRKWAPNASPMR